MAREDADGLLCWLKGPALAVLLVVGREGGATQAQLSATNGWGRTSTYRVLGELAAAGWVEREALRGRWVPTGAGRRAWGEVTGVRGAVPESGTAIHNLGTAVPESDTTIHSPGIVAPKSDTAASSAGAKPAPKSGAKGAIVPESGTKRRRARPNGRKKGTRVPRNGTKRRKGVPENGTAPHDDHDHTSDNMLIQRLEALDTPFEGAPQWLPQQKRKIVVAWLDHREQAPPEVLARYTNPTGLLRTCVEMGIWPRPLPGKHQKRRACVKCGHSVWDADGSCLVCAGVVKW